MTVPGETSLALPVDTVCQVSTPSAQDLDLMDLLGYFYLQHGRPDKAAALIAARVALAPGGPRVLRALALSYVRVGEANRALQILEQVAAAGAIDLSYHLLCAQALRIEGRLSEAATAMRAYVEAMSNRGGSDDDRQSQECQRTESTAG